MGISESVQKYAEWSRQFQARHCPAPRGYDNIWDQALARGNLGDQGADNTQKLGSKRMAKHIFVTGGVVSSLGKGLTSASVGMLLERRGLRIRLQKFDPYINVDPGTMSPYQHGEVYVLDDGAETDLDLGHYERFTNSLLNRDSNTTTGKIYLSVIQKEREGSYYRRDQGDGLSDRDRRCGCGHYGNWRDGWRH